MSSLGWMAIVTSMYNYALRCVEGSGVNVASSQWLLVSVCVLKSLSVSSKVYASLTVDSTWEHILWFLCYFMIIWAPRLWGAWRARY